MGHNWKVFKRNALWLLLLFTVDALAATLLWIADIQAFQAMLGSIILASVLLFAGVFALNCYHDRKKKQAFCAFLNNPDEFQEENLLKLCSEAEGDMIRLLAQMLQNKEDETQKLLTRVSDYEEYVETWAHETKTPLSLLTLLLDNHREDFSEAMGFKLDFVRNRIQESVNQMLFYARLKGVKKDYLFEAVDLNEAVEEVLEDYRPLLEEKQVALMRQIPEIQVYCDKRGLIFLLCQLLSNAVKYSKADAQAHIELTAVEEEKWYTLSIRDNGRGVQPCDLPYIFEKGFTGDSQDGRRKATGMGLYLARAMAGDLNISLEARSQWMQGFEMLLHFPKAHKPEKKHSL